MKNVKCSQRKVDQFYPELLILPIKYDGSKQMNLNLRPKFIRVIYTKSNQKISKFLLNFLLKNAKD